MIKKILITGGAGFIGSHLCEKLSKKNNIICLDNLQTGKLSNIQKIMKEKNFEFINHDITYPIKIKCDEIYNLACPASPVQYQTDPVKTIQTNINGSINMLQLAKKNNARVFQASTSEIYGDPLVHPQKETYWGNVNPIGIRSCYDEGKRAAETLFFDYNRQYKVDIRVLRIFNTYGPRLQIEDGRVVSNFIYQALNNKDITVYGDGYQTRSFCYVDDLVKAIVSFMSLKKNVTGPLNVGNPRELKIIDLAKLIIKMTKSKSKIILKKLPQDDPIRRQPDIKKIKTILKWEPKISIDKGLKKTISYFKNHYELKKR
jgi:UDP-glucuronate decarboxylase